MSLSRIQTRAAHPSVERAHLFLTSFSKMKAIAALLVIVLASLTNVTLGFAEEFLIKSCDYSVYRSLSIDKEHQSKVSWCGLATSRMAMDYLYYKPAGLFVAFPTQCQLASKLASGEPADSPGTGCPDTAPPGLDCCGTDEFTCHCMKARWPEEAFDSMQFRYMNPLSQDLHPPLEWTEVVDEICHEERPYISTITPTGGDRHSVIVHGYQYSSAKIGIFKQILLEIQVYDPLMDVSYWDWQRYTNGFSTSYTHEGDTYKISKILKRIPLIPRPVIPPLPPQ